MTTVLLDSHVLLWWSSDSKRPSTSATRVISKADELTVASITWFELAWLAQHGRINPSMPVRSWLEALSEQVRTANATPAIATTAASFARVVSERPR